MNARYYRKSLSVAALLAVLCSAPPLLAVFADPQAGELVIELTDLRSEKGNVLGCMTAQPKAFPNCDKDEMHYAAQTSASGNPVLVFTDVEPGTYAIAVLHDENANGKADRALGLMPKEGFGFSRDAPVRLGPPSFKSAAFEYTGEGQSQTIKMRYMF